jgi:hypothetical protein
VFLQLSGKGLFGKQRSYLHLEKPYLQEVFFSKTNSILTGNNVLDAPASHTNGFVLRDSCVSSTKVNRPIWKKESLSPP